MQPSGFFVYTFCLEIDFGFRCIFTCFCWFAFIFFLRRSETDDIEMSKEIKEVINSFDSNRK